MGTDEAAAAISDASLDHLRKDLAADTHWPSLPNDDPIAAQKAACEAVSRSLRIVVPRVWQMKDSSDSGCRMRGQIEDLNQLITGALIAHAKAHIHPGPSRSCAGSGA